LSGAAGGATLNGQDRLMTGFEITSDVLLVGLIGFLAQLIDGALGMAFGLVSSTALMTIGVAPAQASAIVHTAEIATTAASAGSHVWFRNVDWKLLARLALAGIAGGVLGAIILSNVDGKAIQPFVAAYLLLMGALILLKALRMTPMDDARPTYAAPLGLVGGFLDAVGGGGWGPLVTSTLIGSGHAPRQVIGTVNTAEFFVTTAIAAAFFSQMGAQHVPYVIALITGGLLAAPFAGYIVKHIRPRVLLVAVGAVVVGLAALQLVRAFA
jgi:hypothetical protein